MKSAIKSIGARWHCNVSAEGLSAAGASPRLDHGVGQTIAVANRRRRKVRAPQGRRPGNAWAMRIDGKCNRKHTAYGARLALAAGKVEKVR